MARSMIEIVNDTLHTSGEDIKISEIIERGKFRLNRLIGVVVDYETDLEAQSLLIDHCRYEYNNASEYFEENFRKELLRLQLMYAVKVYEVPDEI